MVSRIKTIPLWFHKQTEAKGLTPDEIRTIRQNLRLTQVEAGELLGGGPRAFTKYEAGTVRPAGAVVNLLRLLEANPGMLTTLAGPRTRPMTDPETGPFTVTGEHVEALTERDLPELLRRLLSAEAQENGIPANGIHVSSRIHTPDGGEDGRVAWSGGPNRTSFLPCRLCQFQLKAGKIGPIAAGREVLPRNGEVKPMVRSVLEADGRYIMLCAQRYVQRAVEARRAGIREAIRGAGITIDDDRIEFRDADQIAAWVNHHPSVAAWVRERTQPGLQGPFRSWSHWAGRNEHDCSPWIEDERLAVLRGDLRERVAEPRSVIRVVGPSGVGKTRLVLEALRPSDDDDSVLSDLVLYAVESEVGTMRLNETVQSLSDIGNRAIVVVDECVPDTHRRLADMVLRRSSRLSLVTIDHEVATATPEQITLNVGEAPPAVTDAIISRIPLVVHYEDHSRLARFCKGFPKIAIRISEAWGHSIPMARALDDDLVDAFVLGRKPDDPQPASLLKSAVLLATFGLVYREPAPSQLGEIAEMGRGLEEDDLRSGIEALRRRGVVQSRGKAVLLQPRPIAMHLAERQWREWSPAQWDEVLVGGQSPGLKTSAARQLALLNTTEIAQRVAAHVCRAGGPLDGFEQLAATGHQEVLSSLSEINAAVVADRIERCLDDIDDLSKVARDARGHLVSALAKIAFDRRTFDDGARLLLRLATAENESSRQNATRKFLALFPVLLGNTEAPGRARLALLDEAADASDEIQRLIVVEALSAGSETRRFVRAVGSEVQGSRPALEPWYPATNDEATAYISGCVTRLTCFATRDDRAGVVARQCLANRLRSLVSRGFISEVATAVQRVLTVIDQWPRALESLGHAIKYDGQRMDPDGIDRVRKLVVTLEPKSLESRVRFLVTEMPWDYPCDESLDSKTRQQRQHEAVRELARDLVARPSVLACSLQQLSHGEQRMAFRLGQAVAEFARTPLDWLDPVIAAVLEVPKAERNHAVLCGLVVGLAKDFPEDVDALKKRAARSLDLAPALPEICLCLDEITSSDIALVMGAFDGGLLSPERIGLWSAGGVLAKVPASAVAPLIDALLGHSAEASAVAAELVGMYAHGMPDRLEEFRPQIRAFAEHAARWNGSRDQASSAEHHFGQIMKWMLGKGRKDADARATALALAHALVDVGEYRDMSIFEPLVPKLLSEFPEIAWPLISQAIVSDQQRARCLQAVLGDVHSLELREKPALLHLPEDSLFAWCHAHPDRAPKFAAAILPFLTTYKADAAKRSLHPVMARMLDEFGDREGVLCAVDRNICSYSWSGSRTKYYALYEQPVRELRDHKRPQVRRWAKRMLGHLSTEIKEARNEDEERAGLSEVH